MMARARPAYATMTGRLSAAERNELERLAERGLSPGRIALKMSRHPATINHAMTTKGLRPPKARDFCYVRNGSVVRSFSPDEDALISVLRCQEYSTKDIAGVLTKRFGHPRTQATISIRLRQIASREEAGS